MQPTDPWVRADRPWDGGVERTLFERLRRARSASTVAGSLPVLFFGDIFSARAATVGLNPSRREYLDSAGAELDGTKRRFETLASLGASDRSALDDEQARRAIDRMRRYFSGNVYAGWFSRPGRVLRGAGYDYLRDAAHLDLVQEATDPTWSALKQQDRSEHAALLSADSPFLRWLLEAFPLELLLVDGRTALAAVQQITRVQLDSLPPLGKLTISAGAVEVAGRDLVVAGWNRPLARAGLSREQDLELGRRIREVTLT